MVRPKLALGIALGPGFVFLAVACSSSSSTPNPVLDGGADASVPPASDSGVAPDDATTGTADSTSPVADAAEAGAATDGAASQDAASVCVGCASRLSVNGPLAPTCTTNGPPSSHTLLINWGECLCGTSSSCASTCAVCTNGQAAITQACINCGQQQCPSQYAACAADTTGYTADDAGD